MVFRDDGMRLVDEDVFGKSLIKKRLLQKKFLLPCLLFLFCVICRALSLGNPLIAIDEGFYLFTGGQLLEGHLPYVAVWDRKPVGLFLLYAFFHLFGAWRIWAYQIAALFCVWLTALVLMHMARRVASSAGALMSALIYIAVLDIMGGDGGQTAVFYNLLIISAFALVLDLNGNSPDRTCIRSSGYKAMVLFGLALQIKYTVVFEGVFVGLYLLWKLYRSGETIAGCMKTAAVWIFLALVPTILAVIWYAAIGHFHEWWFANMVSIFHRGAEPGDRVVSRAIKLLAVITPFLLCVPLRHVLRLSMSHAQQKDMRLIDLWAFVAVMAVAVFGTYYNYYALPLFLPLCLLVAPLWGPKTGKIWCLVLLAASVIVGQAQIYSQKRKGDNSRAFHALVEAVSHPVGCTFIYNGPAILYDFIRYCPLTDHPFPGHFRDANERGSTGMDVDRELARILDTRPLYIVSREPAMKGEDLLVRSEIYRVLDAEYVPVAHLPSSHGFIVVYRFGHTGKD